MGIRELKNFLGQLVCDGREKILQDDESEIRMTFMIRMTMNRNEAVENSKRIVVKAGSNILTGTSGLNMETVISISSRSAGFVIRESRLFLLHQVLFLQG